MYDSLFDGMAVDQQEGDDLGRADRARQGSGGLVTSEKLVFGEGRMRIPVLWETLFGLLSPEDKEHNHKFPSSKKSVQTREILEEWAHRCNYEPGKWTVEQMLQQLPGIEHWVKEESRKLSLFEVDIGERVYKAAKLQGQYTKEELNLRILLFSQNEIMARIEELGMKLNV